MIAQANSFEGKPCRKCGSTTRYLSKATCVPCTLAYNKNPQVKERRNKQRRTDLGRLKQREYQKRQGVRDRYKAYNQRPETKAKSKYNLRKYKYGIDRSQYDQMLLLQQGLCAICSKALTKPHVDHDHRTNVVRGLLCHNCNTALGFFEDDLTLLHVAVLYLETSNY